MHFSLLAVGLRLEPVYELFKNEKLATLIHEGDRYLAQDEYDSALVCFTIASLRYEDNMDDSEKKLCIHASNMLGILYFQKSNILKAYENFLKVLKMNQNEYAGFIYNNIAGIYGYYGDSYKNIEYLDKSFAWSLEHQDWNNLIITWNNILNAYYEIDSLENIRSRIVQFGQIEIPHSAWYDYVHLVNQGMLHILEGKPEEAISDFKKTIKPMDSIWLNEQMSASSLSNIARTFLRMGEYDSAILYLKKGIKTCGSQPAVAMSLYDMLSRCYKEKGDTNHSLFYRIKHINIRDSIFNTNNLIKIKDLQSLYEIGKIEDKVQELIREKKQRNLLLGTACTVIIVILGSTLLLVKKNRILREANRHLYRKNIEAIENEESLKKLRSESEHLIQQQAEEIALYKTQIGKGKNDGIIGQTLPNPIRQTTDPHDTEEGKNRNHAEMPQSKLSHERKQEILNRIFKIMENPEWFCSPEFTLNKLAELVQTNSTYVSVAINEGLGKNFNSLLNEYRIKEACKRLLNDKDYGTFTYEAIGQSVGFKSRSNFSHTFKKYTGLTINDFKKMAMAASLQENMPGQKRT